MKESRRCISLGPCYCCAGEKQLNAVVGSGFSSLNSDGRWPSGALLLILGRGSLSWAGAYKLWLRGTCRVTHGWEHAVKMVDMEREVPCLHPLPGCAHSPTTPNHGGFLNPKEPCFYFRPFSFQFLACDSKLDKFLINLKTLPRIYEIPRLRFSGSQSSMQPRTPVTLLSIVDVLERRFQPLLLKHLKWELCIVSILICCP